jgi:transposase-like protein
MKYPPDQIATALSLYYEGLSIDAIRRELDNQFHVYPSDSTTYEWIVRYTKVAVDKAKITNISVGDIWVGDETVLDIGGENIWFWDILDTKTRFLLASTMSLTRTKIVAQSLMNKARERAGKIPKYVITDKLAAYIDGVELAFGSETTHLQGSPFAPEYSKEASTNAIERFHSTLKSRTKVMRGMKNRDTAIVIMDGWLIYYNFFRPHEGLNNKTPAEVAKAKFTYKNWKDIVMAGSIKGEACL